MNPPPSSGTSIDEYASVLGIIDGHQRPVIVAGQAVNTWALFYEARAGGLLEAFRPFVSKDLDLAGDAPLLERVRKLSGGTVRYSGPRSPVVGYVEIPVRGEARKVEVLRDVKGLSPSDLTDSVEIEIAGLRLNVLSPPKILKAKICNTVEIDQADRNDVRHVQIALHCVREFVSDYLEAAESGELTQRDAVDLVEEVRCVVNSPLAAKAARMWGFDYSQVWPEALFQCKLEKLARFVEHRLRKPAN